MGRGHPFCPPRNPAPRALANPGTFCVQRRSVPQGIHTLFIFRPWPVGADALFRPVLTAVPGTTVRRAPRGDTRGDEESTELGPHADSGRLGSELGAGLRPSKSPACQCPPAGSSSSTSTTGLVVALALCLWLARLCDFRGLDEAVPQRHHQWRSAPCARGRGRWRGLRGALARASPPRHLRRRRLFRK